MVDAIHLLELTDADKVTLEREFESSGLKSFLKINTPNTPPGAHGCLDPLTAFVIVSVASLEVLAIWICREKRSKTVIQNQSTNETNTIYYHKETHTDTNKCKADVLKQLKMLFPRDKG